MEGGKAEGKGSPVFSPHAVGNPTWLWGIYHVPQNVFLV